MGFEELNQDLNLSNICKGALEADFQKMYQDVVSKLKKGEKGGISIGISFERKDEGTMIWISYSMSPKLPTQKVISYAAMSDDGKLKTSAPDKKPDNVTLFQAKNK